MKALLACLGYLLLGTVFGLASEADSSKAAFSQSDLLSAFSSPIQLGREEADLYNPEDLSALLFLKPSIDIFSLGPFGQKRGFSNWGRIGKGEEILYDGQTRAPIYLNYPQSSEADLTSLQFEQADSVYFFDHPLASFLFGAQAPASVYLHSSSSDAQQPMVSARMNKRNSSGSPFSSALQSTAIFDFHRPLGKKAFVRGIGSFRSSDTVIANDHSENQNYHLSVENHPDSKNHWKGAYELDRELGGIEPFTGIPDPNLSKNFRRDGFFFNMDGRLSENTRIEADLRYERTDQKISSDSVFLRRRVEERRPYFGVSMSRESNHSWAKIYANGDATLLNQHPGRETDWKARFGLIWATKLSDSSIFSAIGQVCDARFETPKLEGWIGGTFPVAENQTLFVTGSSQIIHPSPFDLFFVPKIVADSGLGITYEEVPNVIPAERNYRLNISYKINSHHVASGFSLIAEASNNYLFWRNPPFTAFLSSFSSANEAWGPFFQDLVGAGAETGVEVRQFGVWKGGYGIRYLGKRNGNARLFLSALHRAYFRWTTPPIKPIKALSFRFSPMVYFYSGLMNDIVPYAERQAVLANLKVIGAVKDFSFFYSVENLFDRQYFLRGDLPQPGRSYFFGFNWNLWD